MSYEFEILYAIQNLHNDLLDLIMTTLSAMGNVGMVWIMMAAALMLSRRSRRCGFLMLASMLVCLLFGNGFLKNIIARERPCWIDPSIPLLIPVPEDFSFPSGHTMHGFTAATAVFLHNRRAGIAALCLAAAIAFSRLYLFVHFPTDVLGGMLIGIGAAILVCYLLRKYPLPESAVSEDRAQ